MSALPHLTLIPAGAGSGKTFHIKEKVTEWVKKNRIGADRIAAVTFTESAAGELRERIRNALMEGGRIEDALRLEQSFITTIHGFGNRLLVEYAFEAGQCPSPRLLNEDEEQLLLRKAISRIDRIELLSRQLHRFGYKYDFVSDSADADIFRQRILATIHMLRVIGGDVDRTRRLTHCRETITNTYGPVDDAATLTTALRRSVQSLLKQFPRCMVDFVNSPSAKAHVEDDFRNLQRAALTEGLTHDWDLWKALQSLKVFKNDNQLPADYQDMAREVMACAEELFRHPGPLADALSHAEVLLASAWDALDDYARRKREKGIIDYTDMIHGARQLLEQPEVLLHLARRFDCLVIDEFQDTNPLQFSFLWKLHQAGVPAMIVGDLKQSIMGFQSADPRLMENLLAQHQDNCTPLDHNWRSQGRLMAVVNAFGEQLFGPIYTRLTPRAPFESRLHPIEVLNMEGPGITNSVRSQHIAARVKSILSDETVQIYDRHIESHRPVRGGDIAILGLTHSKLIVYADALRDLGIRVRLAQDGWFMSREVQLAYYGLCFVADPMDSHAALYLAVTELGEDELTSALQTLLGGKELTLPLLQRLKDLGERQSELAVDELVAETLEAMTLFDLVTLWPEGNQARANLLRLLGEARTFVEADREALAGGGYYGSGLKTFLAWLKSQLETKDGDRQPDARVHDEEAVQLMTWHAAKGREWPIVIVTTLDRTVGGKLPSLDIQYSDFSDLDHILEQAWLAFSPDFAARETKERFKASLDEKARQEGLNLLYVVLTRAREQLILEWQSNLQASTRYTYWHLLQEAGRVQLQENQLLIGESAFPCPVFTVNRELPSGQAGALSKTTPLPQLGRRALQTTAPPEELTPIFVTPSRLHGAEYRPASPPRTLTYTSPLSVTLPSGADRGLLIHRVMELLGQDIDPAKARQHMGADITPEDWDQLAPMTQKFMEWLQGYFQPSALHWEVPITSRNNKGSVVSGTVDLLVQTTEGYFIIDHKSDEPQDLAETFNHYLPQLLCYAEALAEGAALPVCGVAIHWVCLGCISLSDPLARS